MNRRAAIAAVVTVSAILFVIRVGIVYLKKEAGPPPSSVVDRSRSSPVTPPSPSTVKSEAKGKLRMLATEAREANAIRTATAAYDADGALDKDDCAGAQAAMARAADGLAADSPAHGALDTASRSVNAYCEH